MIIICINFYLNQRTAAEEQSNSLIYIDNIKRTYELFIPSTKNQNELLPVVIVLHGGGSWGKRMSTYTNFIPLAEKENFIAVFPDSYQGNWNDGRKNLNSVAHKENINDLKFISEIVNKLVKDNNADKNRVYVTGISNGAMMALRIGCELSDLVSAIASVEGGLPLDLKCKPEKNLSVLLINGTSDPVIPWNGGDITFGFQKRGKIYSAEDNFNFWLKHNQCKITDKDVWEILPDTDINDGTLIYKKSNQNCNNQSEVILYKVENGGHSWPGAFEYNFLQKWVAGRTSKDMNATEVIWNFFKKNKKDS